MTDMPEQTTSPSTPAVVEDSGRKQTLEELFDGDPLGWTDDDVETIVATLRAQRHKFNLTEQAKQVEGKPRGRATSLPKSKPTPAALPTQISLSDLGLDD